MTSETMRTTPVAEVMFLAMLALFPLASWRLLPLVFQEGRTLSITGKGEAGTSLELYQDDFANWVDLSSYLGSR